MTRIAIAGAAGRMGRNLVLACSETDGLELTQALDREQSPALGTDSGILAGIAENRVLISDTLDATAFDILIDFTHPSATTGHLDFCKQNGKRMVIGTTGSLRPWHSRIGTSALATDFSAASFSGKGR